MPDNSFIRECDKKNKYSDGVMVWFAKGVFLKTVSRIKSGQITVIDGKERRTFGEATPEFDRRVTVTVCDVGFYPETVFGGAIGLSEAYMLGYWQTDDLAGFIRIMCRNRDFVKNLGSSIVTLAGAIGRNIYHALRKNSLTKARANIQAHYDLGNEFFKIFLDPTMMYSCAFFKDSQMSLEEASIAKIDRICRKLHLSPADCVIEIGTGWGSFAIYAAKNYGAHVTTTTISEEQHAYVKTRIEKEGLQGRVTVLKEDYRKLTGKFDKLVSIEMIEAVGYQYYEDYFASCANLLKDSGQMLLQAIVIEDQRFEWSKKHVDYIKRFIFPGSCIPSVTEICRVLTKATDLRLFAQEDITVHYVTTLRKWREKFLQNRTKILNMGYSEEFVRMWEYYFCYCEGGFAERSIADVQMILTKPLYRPEKNSSSVPVEKEPAGTYV